MKQIKLTDLISVETLQQIQDGFSKYTGMAALTTDSDGVPVTKGSGFTRFCMELTRQSRQGCKNCEECDKNGALSTLKNGHASVYDCHAGLVDFAAPIMVEGMFLGSFIGGQVRTTEVNEEGMRQTAKKYDIDPEDYVAAARETECLSKDSVEKAAQFLEEIAAGLSGMAYRNYITIQESAQMENAAKSQANFIMNMSMDMEKSMERWFQIIEEKRVATENKEMQELLLDMQNASLEMRSNIRDTIEYIRMSASKVELFEKEYNLQEFADTLKYGFKQYYIDKNIQVDVLIKDCVVENLFGDIGRIGQMMNRIVKNILESKEKGELVLEISTKQVSYATMLYISIIDKHTNYTHDDIAKMKDYFVKENIDNFVAEDLDEMWVSYVSLILEKMAGSISFDYQDENLAITVSMPQLAL